MVDERSAGLDSQLSSPLTPLSFFDTEHESDNDSFATTVPQTVMAEQVTNDVVKEAQSVGRPAPIDDTASTTNTPAANGELPSGPATTNSTISEPPSIATNATSADAALADSTHVSGKAGGPAAVVCRDGHDTCKSVLMWVGYGRAEGYWRITSGYRETSSKRRFGRTRHRRCKRRLRHRH